MPFVLDASVTASWFFPDEDHPDAAEAWRLIKTDDALVPPHWWFEVRNTMLIGERRGRNTEQRTTAALDRLSRMRIQFAPQPDETSVFGLARRHRLTFYDAAYLDLAQRQSVALATLDDDLVTAARAERVDVIVAP
ncbi:MAG: PIN domain-containing protein [Rhizobiales bacterium]|nr:PIN domain-containing protein [Hyphomicrobiales bacterium]